MKEHDLELPMETTMKPARPWLCTPAFATALVLLPLRFDDPPRPQSQPPLPLPSAGTKKDDAHAEMRRLFGKIEKDLREIDRLLSDASAGGSSTSDAARRPADAAQDVAKEVIEGIDKLLDASQQRGKAVVAGIDRILELADHAHAPGESCSGSPGGLCRPSGSSGRPSDQQQNQNNSQGQKSPGGSDPGKSPLDRQGGDTTQRESTPQAPEKTPSGKTPGEGGDGEKPGQPKSETGTPHGNQDSDARARNAQSGAPPASPTDAARSGKATVEKWGELPVHVRDVFRAQGGGDMPTQYRDWIDAYYRRLAKRTGS